MTEPGLFLVLEGIEGSGKSTQARLLIAWLEALGRPHTLAREPGGTEVGEAIRKVLLDAAGVGMPAETELLLMLSARAAFVRGVVRPALARGEVMVSDRFEFSTFAYQGVGRGLGVEEVQGLNRFATGGLRPHLTLVFDLPASEGRQRQFEAGKRPDRIEGEGIEFLEAVRDGYRSLANADPTAELIDGGAPAETVHLRVRELLLARFPEHFRRGRV